MVSPVETDLTPISSVGSNRERGVTLIEMLVVVIIISLVVAISTPSVGAGIDAIRLATASSTVAAFLNSAATRAERHQRPVELILSPGNRSLRVISTDAGSLKDMDLPDGISMEAASSTAENGEAESRWLFMPGGAVPAVAIQLRNQHGGRRIVRLDPMTGFPRVETVKAE